jgi:hypothetical protein
MSDPLLASWAVGSIVRELCERAGVPYDAIDSSLLEGLCDGFYATGGSSSAGASIEALAGVYQFDASNYDGALHFIPRGGTAIAEITDDDLVDDGSVVEMTTRADPINIPRVMQLKYFDTKGGLTPDQQVSDRSNDYRANSEDQRQTVVIMQADDAMRSITIQHKVEIEEQRGDREFVLPINWLFLTVADIVMFRGERMRITTVNIDDNLQKYVARFDRLSAYSASGYGLPILEPEDPVDNVPSDTVLHVIDCPILADQDDSTALYIAVSGESSAWSGAIVQASRDEGETWQSVGAMRTSATMGETISELTVGSVFYPDVRNYVDVELLREDMTLISATLPEMMNRVNLAIIGDELINFSGVEQLTATTWRLSGFLRGRKQTASVTHPIGTRFVLLNSAMITFRQVELYDVGRTVMFRATSIGAAATEDTQTITYIARSQIEPPPSYLRARRYRDGIHQKVELSWQGIGRLGGGSRVGMGQYFKGFVDGNAPPAPKPEYIESPLIFYYDSGHVYRVSQYNIVTQAGEPAEATA